MPRERYYENGDATYFDIFSHRFEPLAALFMD
jgi:hypothetical protein